MNQFKINFDDLEWESTADGARFKVFRRGDKQVRLAEFTRDFVETDWCVKNHIGFVLEGKLEIDFKGEKIQFTKGDGIFIPADRRNAHKARSLTSKVKLILVEEITKL